MGIESVDNGYRYRKIKGIIFDLDDTLYNEIDYVYSGFRKVAKYLEPVLKRGEEEIFYDLIDIFKLDKGNVFDKLIKKYNLETNSEDIILKCIDIYRSHYPDIKLSAETEGLLHYLKNKNYKLGIITDGRPQGQKNKIKALDLEKFVDYIIITDELGGVSFRKPHTLAYLKMKEYFNVEAEQIVCVADNPAKDFITPNKLGMLTVMVKNKKSIHPQKVDQEECKPEIVIDRIEELIKILEWRS